MTVQEYDNFSLCEAIVNLWEQDEVNFNHVVYVNTTVPWRTIFQLTNVHPNKLLKMESLKAILCSTYFSIFENNAFYKKR